MSGQEQTQKSDLEAFKGLVDYVNDSFVRIHSLVGVVPANFVYDLMQSFEIPEKEKAGIIQSLGEIGIMVDLLKTGYDNRLGAAFLEDPDNVKEFTAIMSRLLALYRGFTNGEIINATELLLGVNDVASDLQSFFIRYMKSINAPE